MLLTEHAQMVCENSAYCTLNHFLTHLASHPRGGGLERKRRNPRMPLKSVYMSRDSLHLFNDVQIVHSDNLGETEQLVDSYRLGSHVPIITQRKLPKRSQKSNR